MSVNNCSTTYANDIDIQEMRDHKNICAGPLYTWIVYIILWGIIIFFIIYMYKLSTNKDKIDITQPFVNF